MDNKYFITLISMHNAIIALVAMVFSLAYGSWKYHATHALTYDIAH